MKTLSLTLALVLVVSNAFAKPNWDQLSGGQHSMKALGTDFYVDVPVRRIPGAKITLSFVNTQLVEQLGLELPGDSKEAEKMLLEHFAWEVDPNGNSPKKWFATHYQDSNAKGPGEAQGDGRALWTGELKLERPDGKILYVDGVQKGVGPTPYAWLNNSTHKDGKQNTNELIISGIRSMADSENNLDSTSDILGFTIHDASGNVRSMTLRVGRQTRPAHIRWHDDNPKNEKKMMDYIVSRDLGLPSDTIVTDAMFVQWEQNFAVNNAEDTARVFALNAFYEHPTAGNKTTTGGSIDLNGRQYMDAYHANMSHLHGRLFVRDQIELQKNYLAMINNYLGRANYRSNVGLPALTARLGAVFDRTFRETASKLFLNSLGLSQIEIESVPESVRLDVFNAVSNLMRAEGTAGRDMILQNKGMVPAAFDTRKILRGTMEAFAKSSPERAQAIKELYKVDYQWNTTHENLRPELRVGYEASIARLVTSLGGHVRANWITAAALRNPKTRFDSTTDGVWDYEGHPIRKEAEAGTNWVEVSKRMLSAARRFVDPERPARPMRMLQPKMQLTGGACRDLFKAVDTLEVPSEIPNAMPVPQRSRLRQVTSRFFR